MELDALTSGLGVFQGRVEGLGFVLGSVDPGRLAELAVGDFVELTQPLDVTDVALVRATLSLRVPALPAGLAWQVGVVVDGVVTGAIVCGAGRERGSSDIAGNVSKLTGVHEVGVRLTLIAL